MKLIPIFIICLSYVYGNSQIDSVMGQRFFHSIKEAQTVHPDSVTNLQLGNNDLRSFPIEILQFKNLNFLSFIDLNIGEIYDNTPWLLSEKEKAEAMKGFEKWGRNIRSYPEGTGGFPTYHKNKIGVVSTEITQLKNLVVLYFERYQISKREYKRLKKLLPNCTIERI